VYGTVRTVVWEDGGSNPASYPIQTASAATAAGNATVNFQLQTSGVPAMTAPVTLLDSGAIPIASLGVNSSFKFKLPTSGAFQEFLALNFLVSNGPLTAGGFTAAIALNVDDSVAYPSGFTVV